MIDIREKLSNYTVGVAGLGGLGSNAAALLARSNIGHLIIADFDKVEKCNLNRQNYFKDQVGMLKTEASAEILSRINADVRITKVAEKLDQLNIPAVFAECDIIMECLDNADQKQIFTETVLTEMANIPVVCVSGIAGYGRSNSIQTRRISDRFILVGDTQTGIETEPLLTGPRVAIAACHQSNAVIEMIIEDRV